MIGDKARKEVISKTAKKPLQTCAYISLRDVKHKKGELPNTDPDFRFTNFTYYVKYKKSANKSFKYKPYMVVADIFKKTNGSFRVGSYNEFLERAEENPEISWLVRNTIHSKELFDMAKHNYHIPIMLMFDPVKYMHKVLENEGEKVEDSSVMNVFLIKDIAEAERIRHEEYLEQYNKKEVKL